MVLDPTEVVAVVVVVGASLTGFDGAAGLTVVVDDEEAVVVAVAVAVLSVPDSLLI